MNPSQAIKQILLEGTEEEKKALFSFNSMDSDDSVLLKFNLWARYFFHQYFTSKDAKFHNEIDNHNLQVYRGTLDSFLNIAFRGAAKTARTKLFIAFCIANDQNRMRRYFKILCADITNSRQIVTDIYNIFVSPRVFEMYPNIFEKTNAKREETMNSFTTSFGVKVISDTVGTDQRGAIQEDARPDFVWFEDFENRTTLRSGKKTKAIWENMEEARTGLAINGGCIYTCNYISETGNVHQLINKGKGLRKKVLIVPIVENNVSTWPDRYSLNDIEQMRKDDDDFAGERLCKPSASMDVLFDRDTLDSMDSIEPIREIAGFKLYKKYNPSHRYGSGHDVAGGVGLDSSTSVFIDFDTVPAQVVGVFANNTIKPDVFGDEIARESAMFGNCIVGIEKNNHGHATIARARQLDVNLYQTQQKETKVGYSQPTEYGWLTNGLTKPRMLFALAKAIEDGLLLLNDEDLIYECKGYSRNDLLDDEDDPRLTTRHFDLLIAAAIAWQMKDFARYNETEASVETRSNFDPYDVI